MSDVRVRRGIGCGFGGAMVLAPFLAWFWGMTAAVGVMIVALAATCYLAFDTSRTADAPFAQRLRILAVVNGIALIGCLIVMVVLIVGE
jgi:hypothetical protein